MNYFLENHVSKILKVYMNKSTNRAVRKLLEYNLTQEGLPKYLSLLRNYE